jgi:metal-responsive CopG/Arc/MetJ family transcriptional regulator
MPNPLLSVRIPLDLQTLLEQKEAEMGKSRSELAIAALQAYLMPTTEQSEIEGLKVRVAELERVVRSSMQATKP